MRVRTVPSEDISSRSLRARDYIPQVVKKKTAATLTPTRPGESYEEKVMRAFRDASKINGPGQGASAAEVTELLFQRGELSRLDSCLDIADIMKKLRAEGRL